MSTYNSITTSNLKKEFMMQSKYDKKVNSAFNDLWVSHRNFFDDCSFFNYTVQGYLNKEPEENRIKLFKQKVYKRYFLIDFAKACIQIKSAKESRDVSTTISFRKITKGYA